jgi:hypothetical protein
MTKKLLWGLLWAVVLYKIIFMLTSYYISHDIYVHLDIAMRLLDGAKPYIDYIETNFPTAHYLHIPPVWLSEISPLSLTRSFYLYISLLSFASAGVCFYLLRRFDENNEKDLFFLTIALTIGVLFIDFPIRESYGQREHFFMLMFLPFVILAWIRSNKCYVYNRYLLIGIGFVAGIALTIKPYFFLLLLVILLLGWVKSRTWRLWREPEWWGIGLAGIVYMLFVVINWESTQVFLFEQLPQTIKNYGVYGNNGRVVGVLLETFTLELVICIGLLGMGIYAYRKHPQKASLTILWGLLMVASVVIVDLQDKAWHYHFIPFQLFGYLGMIILIAYLLPALLKKDILITQTITLVILLVITPQADRQILADVTHDLTEDINLIRDNSEEDDSIVGISTSVVYSRLILMADRKNVTTHLSAHPIPFELSQFRLAQDVYSDGIPYVSDEIQKYLTIVTNDITENHPKLVIIDQACFVCPNGLSLDQYLNDVGFMEMLTDKGYRFLLSHKMMLFYVLDEG